MTNPANNIPPKNIVLPWPQTIQDVKPYVPRSLFESGISSMKNMVNRMIDRNPSDHASGVKKPQEINKIALVGIHGWYPGKILKTGKLIYD